MALVVPQISIDISDELVSTPSTDLIKVLLVGIKGAGGTAVVNTPTQIFSMAQAIELAEEGSPLAQQVRYLRDNNNRINLTIVAMAAPVGAAATATATFGGLATTATPLVLQVEDKTVTVPVSIGDDGTAIALATSNVLAEAGYDRLHVTAAPAVAVLTFTAKQHGEHANEISIRNVSIPPGVTSVIVPMAGGAGVGDVASALASLGAERYNYIGLVDTNATNLTAVVTFLDARFDKDIALDGHAIAGKRDSVGNLATLGLGLDTKQVSIFGDPNLPSNPWCQAAVVCAVRATQSNPKVAIRKDNLTPLIAPPSTEYLDPDDRNTLLSAGISVYIYVQGVPRVDRFVTLSKTNSLGQPSNAYRDVETKLTVSEIRQFTIALYQPLISKILVDDASSPEFGLAVADEIIDAEGARQLMIAQHRDVFIPLGWTSDPEAYEASLVVEKTASDTLTYQAFPKINGNLYQVIGTEAFTL